MTSPAGIVGRRLGHYRILEQIGAGGMGVVYRARDERLERDVALKVLPPGSLEDHAARKRFRKEALALSCLNHPNIATVHDVDSENGTDFLVTELVPGVSVKTTKPLSKRTDETARRFARRAAFNARERERSAILLEHASENPTDTTTDTRAKRRLGVGAENVQ